MEQDVGPGLPRPTSNAKLDVALGAFNASWMDPDYDYYYYRPPPPPNPPSNRPTVDYNQINTIHFVLVGIILPIGFFFNILSIVVFVTSRTLRKTTTGHYLLALSIADTLFLVGELLRWINTPNLGHLGIHVHFVDRVDPLCKLVMCLRYGAKLSSAWITVMITVERFITVTFPLRVSAISTPRIAKIAICVTFLLSFLSGSFPMWTVGVVLFDNVLMCIVLPDHRDLYDTLNWVFLRAASLLVPWVLIVIFCVLIAIFLTRATTRRRTLSISRCNSQQSRTSTQNLEKQLTTTLLAVAAAFVLLRLPYTIAYYIYANRGWIFGDDHVLQFNGRLFYAQKMADVFVSVNYAINFFLYCMCGSSFRRQLVNLFHGRMNRRPSQRSYDGSSLSRNGHAKNNIAAFELTRNGNKFVRGMSRQDSRIAPYF